MLVEVEVLLIEYTHYRACLLLNISASNFIANDIKHIKK